MIKISAAVTRGEDFSVMFRLKRSSVVQFPTEVFTTLMDSSGTRSQALTLDSGISLDLETGIVSFTFSSIGLDPKSYSFDVFATVDGVRSHVIEGNLTVESSTVDWG